LYASKVLKVLYSPRKTLKEVIQDPKYVGPALVMILLIAASVGSLYVVFSRVYDQQFLPQGANLDEWTQNSTLWTSNGTVTESNDSITGTYYGNASMSFSIQDTTQIWMQLGNIGPVNCFAPDAYDLLEFRVKWTSPVARPENVSVQMFSSNSSDGYFNSLIGAFSNSTYNIWNNITVPLASAEWRSFGQSSDWSNITGLQFQFTWADSSNVTMLVDGLFFLGPYQSRLQTAGLAYLLSYGVFSGAMQFVVTWVVLSGIIYAFVRAFGGKLVWKPLLIAVGFILITMFIGALITVIGYSTWSTIRIPFDLLGGVPGEGVASNKVISDQTSLVYEVITIVQYAMWIWSAALAALVTHITAEFSWAKSALVGVLSYFITLLVVSFIVG
jgi:hypothetical protein